MKNNKPNILLLDVETAPLLSFTWDIWDQNIGLNQIKSDWHLLSWSAKWLGSPSSQIMYMDQRKEKNVENDKRILRGIWKLMDDADIIIGQNSKKFDIKRLNTRFALNNMPPPSSFRQIDTLSLAKKHFSFTSNKLEYLTDHFCTKYKKLKHKKYPGFEMWKECLAGNQDAWKHMEKYNKWDVLSLEELYHKLQPWGTGINVDVYNDGLENICICGNKKFKKNGYFYNNIGKYPRLKCTKCGSEAKIKNNILTKEKRKSLLK